MMSLFAEDMMAKGEQRGMKQGMKLGMELGIQRGIRQGKINALLRLLTQRFGVVSPQVQELVNGAEREKLALWCNRIFDARSIEEFFGSDWPTNP